MFILTHYFVSKSFTVVCNALSNLYPHKQYQTFVLSVLIYTHIMRSYVQEFLHVEKTYKTKFEVHVK
jgi:hypothetical protein